MSELQSSDDPPTRYFTVLPLQISVALPEEITEDLEHFYGRACHSAFAGYWQLAHDADFNSDALVLTAETRTDDARVAVKTMVANAAWQTDPSVGALVLDLSNPGVDHHPFPPNIRGSIFHAIAQGIADSAIAHEDLAFLILLRELPPLPDKFTRVLRSLIDVGRVVVSDDAGRIFASSNIESRWNSTDYRRYIRAIRRDPLEQLELKLVKMLGWFTVSRSKQPSYYARHYYDISLCQEEIYEILAARLDEGPSGSTPPIDLAIILSSDSRQLAVTVSRLEHDRKIRVLAEEDLEKSDISSYKHAMIVTEVVASGASIAKVVEELRRRSPKISAHGFAVLSTEKFPHRKRSVGTRPGTRVVYCTDIDQRRISSEDPKCLPVAWNFLPSAQKVSGQTRLTAFQFWDLVRQCGGVELEKDIPWNRRRGRLVPTIHTMIKEFGPWLVLLMHQAVTQRIDAGNRNVIYVCPDAEINSGILSDAFRAAVDVPVVRVPREAFEFVSALTDQGETPEFIKRSVRSRWPGREHRWIRELESGQFDQAVVFDDICVTGKTQLSLAVTLDVFGIDVSVYAVVVRFDSGEQPYEIPLDDICSLYTLPSVYDASRSMAN